MSSALKLAGKYGSRRLTEIANRGIDLKGSDIISHRFLTFGQISFGANISKAMLNKQFKVQWKSPREFGDFENLRRRLCRAQRSTMLTMTECTRSELTVKNDRGMNSTILCRIEEQSRTYLRNRKKTASRFTLRIWFYHPHFFFVPSCILLLCICVEHEPNPLILNYTLPIVFKCTKMLNVASETEILPVRNVAVVLLFFKIKSVVYLTAVSWVRWEKNV